MERTERRSTLETTANPGDKLDYVVTLTGHTAPISGKSEGGDAVRVGVRYIPDRVVIDPASFGKYLDRLGQYEWSNLEEIAAAILDDLNNETVARWVQITITAPDRSHPGIDAHAVMVEDRQPKWDNPILLSRLQPI